MIEQLSEYLVQAHIAVLLFVYIWLSDKQKMKFLKGLQDHNKELMELIRDLTRKK